MTTTLSASSRSGRRIRRALSPVISQSRASPPAASAGWAARTASRRPSEAPEERPSAPYEIDQPNAGVDRRSVRTSAKPAASSAARSGWLRSGESVRTITSKRAGASPA